MIDQEQIEEAYCMKMDVEKAIDVLNYAKILYSSFGSLSDAIETLLCAYQEQKEKDEKIKELLKKYHVKQMYKMNLTSGFENAVLKYLSAKQEEKK